MESWKQMLRHLDTLVDSLKPADVKWKVETRNKTAQKGRSGAETHVPIVANHNNQIRLNIGDHLRLECPVHSTSSGSLTDFDESGTNTIQHDEASGVLYHWRVRDRLDYTLDSDPRYRFSQNRRVLEVTVPLEVSDSGTYTCTGVTGFGKREVTFEVHVRDPDSNLLCAPTPRTHQNVKGTSTFQSAILYHLELDSFASQLKQFPTMYIPIQDLYSMRHIRIRALSNPLTKQYARQE
ncbi:hypothetical protein CLF_106414 [Clonorchis sinensis]|uniref:Ig-like domain-containing protein n=1 Tax=Clonorchis sinensis TaxID=79923 RepID=G7YF56_CLOSI|nr:hypothetical protein CLF_106414 [Clonorchis sinensis]